MKHQITEAEYLSAITSACEIVDAMHADPTRPTSQQDHLLKIFLAAIYDPITPCDVLESLMQSDYARRELLLTLLIGRCNLGRPRHPRADEFLTWSAEIWRAASKR